MRVSDDFTAPTVSLWIASGALLLVLAGCPTTPVNSCVPGETQRCACLDGDGVQECLDDGTYGSCMCADDEPEPEPDETPEPEGDDAGMTPVDAGGEPVDAGEPDMPPPMDGGVPPILVPPGSGHRVGQGDKVSCWIDPEDHIRCFGSNVNGRAAAPEGLYGAMAMGPQFGCGLNRSGRVQCWGDDSFNQLTEPTGIFVQVAAGERHVCALRGNGSAECWGDSAVGQGNAPPLAFVSIAAGAEHTCGLLPEGIAVCWGQNRWGQSAAPENQHFTSLALSENTSCGLTLDDEVQCWGIEDEGTSQPPVGQFTAISGGRSHFCALDMEGRVVCWGDISGAPQGRFNALASGRRVTCAYASDGSRRCFGGDGFMASVRLRPHAVKDIHANSEQVCLRTTADDLQCMPRDGVTQAPAFTHEGPFDILDVGEEMACGTLGGFDFGCFGRHDEQMLFDGRIAAIAIDGQAPDRVLVQDATGLHAVQGGAKITFADVPVMFTELEVEGSIICGVSEGRVHRFADGSWTEVYSAGDAFEPMVLDDDKCCWLDSLGKLACQHHSNPLGYDEDFIDIAVHAGSGVDSTITGYGLERETGEIIDLVDEAVVQLPHNPQQRVMSIPSLSCAVHAQGSAQCWGQEALHFD